MLETQVENTSGPDKELMIGVGLEFNPVFAAKLNRL